MGDEGLIAWLKECHLARDQDIKEISLLPLFKKHLTFGEEDLVGAKGEIRRRHRAYGFRRQRLNLNQGWCRFCPRGCLNSRGGLRHCHRLELKFCLRRGLWVDHLGQMLLWNLLWPIANRES